MDYRDSGQYVLVYRQPLLRILLANFCYGLSTTRKHLSNKHTVAIEQFGYGFGFTSFMMYIIYIAEGHFKTAHYAIATGFMAMGMMIPGMFSGWIQEKLGYPHFFIWVMIATIPAFYVIAKLPLEKDFAKANIKDN